MLICQKIHHKSIYQNVPQDVEVIASYIRGIGAVTIENNCLKDEINFMRQKTFHILIGQHTCNIKSLSQEGFRAVRPFSVKCWIGDKIFGLLSVNFDGG